MKSVAALAALLAAATAISGCPGGGKQDATSASAPSARATAPDSAPEAQPTAAADPVERGKAIYTGTDYSNTGLTCAHCHAASAAEEEGRIFIAHSGYGAATRGAWKITSQEQLDAKKGFAATLVEAANACVGAPYMNHKEKLIEGEDAAALLAYLESISDPAAKDGAAFIIAKAKALPAGGLTPDKENGKRIYEQSCEHCHDAGIEGLEELHGAKDWLNPVQVMAKVRKLDGWYENYETAKYAQGPRRPAAETRFAGLYRALGLSTALAEENPCGENPCGEAHEGHDHEGHEHHEEGEEHDVFPEGAMPFFGTDILSDQDVVDVAFYVAEEV